MRKSGMIVVVALALVFMLSVSAFAAPKLSPKQEITYNLVTEPRTIDPGLSNAVVEMNVILSNFEGLMRLGPGDVPLPGVAQTWEISKDGLTYTFHLRKNAKWSNGDPVTAADFEYAWKRALDPKLAGEYAYQLYYIKNGEAYNTKKITDPNQIGVKAKDPYTLEVTLEGPCSYFLTLCYFPTLAPLNKKIVEANGEKWAVDPKTYVGNGPFRLTKWVHNERMEFEPNPYYWNKKAVKAKKLNYLLVVDQSASLAMFESGQVDFIDDTGISRPEIPRLQEEGTLKFSPYLGTYYYLFNLKHEPVKDIRVRQALAMAIDRAKLVKFVTKAGETPAYAFVPNGIPDAAKGTIFRKVGGNFFKESVAAAKKLLAEAGYPGGKGLPTIEILYNTSEMHKQMAEAIQEMWKKNLNINVTLVNQEWGVYMDNRRQLAYTNVCRAGWIGDYVDPMTFIDLFTTTSGNNHTGWSNAQYDKLVDIAKSSGDQKVRMKAMHDAESLLMKDMVIMPVYFYTRPYMMKPWIKNVRQSALGFVDFSRAYVAEH